MSKLSQERLDEIRSLIEDADAMDFPDSFKRAGLDLLAAYDAILQQKQALEKDHESKLDVGTKLYIYGSSDAVDVVRDLLKEKAADKSLCEIIQITKK